MAEKLTDKWRRGNGTMFSAMMTLWRFELTWPWKEQEGVQEFTPYIKHYER
jgi:hypothetical protein